MAAADWPPAPTYALPILVDEKTGQSQFNPIWLDWFLQLSQVLTAAGAGSGGIEHNSLAGLDGGTAGEEYHLTSAQHTTLTADKAANTVYAGPASGANAAPAFRAGVAADVTFTATQRALGRNTAGSGVGEEVTASQLLDWLGSTRGAVLYRGASGWTILAPGTSGDVLTSNGAGADPTYQAGGGGSADPDAWTTEEVVTVSSSQALAATFPSSGIFDTAKEYRIEFNGWTVTTDGDGRARFDVGGGVISTSSYERGTVSQIAGGNIANVTIGASGSTVVLLTSGMDSAGHAAGYMQFIPGLQATTKAPVAVKSRFVATSGVVGWFSGAGALSTPVNAAIQKVQLDAPSNTTAGTFILKSRPLVPTL